MTINLQNQFVCRVWDRKRLKDLLTLSTTNSAEGILEPTRPVAEQSAPSDLLVFEKEEKKEH
jgi:hypothetical protein